MVGTDTWQHEPWQHTSIPGKTTNTPASDAPRGPAPAPPARRDNRQSQRTHGGGHAEPLAWRSPRTADQLGCAACIKSWLTSNGSPALSQVRRCLACPSHESPSPCEDSSKIRLFAAVPCLLSTRETASGSPTQTQRHMTGTLDVLDQTPVHSAKTGSTLGHDRVSQLREPVVDQPERVMCSNELFDSARRTMPSVESKDGARLLEVIGNVARSCCSRPAASRSVCG